MPEPNEAKTESPVQDQPVNYKYEKGDDLKTIYSNHAMFQVALFEIAILFGESQNVNQATATVTIEQHVKIVMTPIQAKIFAALALQQIQTYESRFGEIKMPPGIITANAPTQSKD